MKRAIGGALIACVSFLGCQLAFPIDLAEPDASFDGGAPDAGGDAASVPDVLADALTLHCPDNPACGLMPKAGDVCCVTEPGPTFTCVHGGAQCPLGTAFGCTSDEYCVAALSSAYVCCANTAGGADTFSCLPSTMCPSKYSGRLCYPDGGAPCADGGTCTASTKIPWIGYCPPKG